MPDGRVKYTRVFGRVICHEGGRLECLGAVQVTSLSYHASHFGQCPHLDARVGNGMGQGFGMSQVADLTGRAGQFGECPRPGTLAGSGVGESLGVSG